MKYPLASKLGTFLVILAFAISQLTAQVPRKPVPPRLVNDMAQILTPAQANEMETRLVSFAQETSNQILVVTLASLDGNDKAQLAFSIGEEWGVGDSKFNNGIVILVKPKTDRERGEAFIAVGYGLEGALPDAVAKRIVEYEMIPHFRENLYFEGIKAALDVILPIAAGEFSHSDYKKGEEGSLFGSLVVLFLVILFVTYLVKKGGNTTHMGGGRKRGPSALDLLLLGSILSSGRGGRSGGFGGGSFGGGGFGGGSFGGFGGGSFGGGGAGGSW